MARKCERPSCKETGDVAYIIDTANLVVSIDAPVPRDSSRVNILCRRHADSLTVPKGWTIINNREEVQRLFSAPITQEVSKNNSRKVVRRQSVSDFNDDKMNRVAIANLFDLVIDDHLFATADHATVDAGVNITADITAELAQLMDTQETQGLPWTPRFDRSGDLDGKLRARGRLLGRAFGNTDVSSDHENYQDSQCDHDHDQSNLES